MIQLILVDENDKPVGEAEKMEVHQKGLLHRAFSIFLYTEDKILLQKRAKTKYHSPGLWTNSCCGHPNVGEEVERAAKRRLFEELGLKEIPLKKLCIFHYCKDVGQGLIENEIDHLFIGEYEGLSIPFNPDEAEEVAWRSVSHVFEELQTNPDRFTAWFSPAFEHFQALKRTL